MLGVVIDGKYRVLRYLGRGGMATVFEAEHLALGTPVALKIGHPNQEPESRERFLREARNAARVDHPNVVRFLDAGRMGVQSASMPTSTRSSRVCSPPPRLYATRPPACARMRWH